MQVWQVLSSPQIAHPATQEAQAPLVLFQIDPAVSVTAQLQVSVEVEQVTQAPLTKAFPVAQAVHAVAPAPLQVTQLESHVVQELPSP